MASSSPDATEQKRLTELGQQAGLYLLASPIAPLIAPLLVMSSRQPIDVSTGLQVPKEPAMITLVAIAIAGFGAAYVTWQRIRNDFCAERGQPAGGYGGDDVGVGGYVLRQAVGAGVAPTTAPEQPPPPPPPHRRRLLRLRLLRLLHHLLRRGRSTRSC